MRLTAAARPRRTNAAATSKSAIHCHRFGWGPTRSAIWMSNEMGPLPTAPRPREIVSADLNQATS
jgi:hypothetical protein